MTGARPKLLFDWVSHPLTPVREIFPIEDNETEPSLGKGFELPLGSLWLDEENQKWHRWSERWLVIQSYALARRQQQGLEKRLLNAEKALAKLAAKPGQDSIVWQESVEKILQRHRVSEYLLTNIDKKISYAKVYERSGRPSLNRGATRKSEMKANKGDRFMTNQLLLSAPALG